MMVSEILYAALRIAGVTNGPGRTPSPEQYQDAFNALNRMLGSWNTERCIPYTTRIDQFPLNPSTQVYTLGPGGDFDAPRPQRIERANILLPTSPQALRRPLQILNDEQWSLIKLQGVVSTYPTKLYSDGAYPLTNIYLWPIPSVGNALELYTWQALSSFYEQDDEVTLPAGYEEAITFNLAARIASLFRTKLTPEAAEIAIKSKAAIKSLNMPNPLMACDPGILPAPRGGSFNWLTGETQ